MDPLPNESPPRITERPKISFSGSARPTQLLRHMQQNSTTTQHADQTHQPEPPTPPEPNRTHLFDSDPDPGTDKYEKISPNGKSANHSRTGPGPDPNQLDLITPHADERNGKGPSYMRYPTISDHFEKISPNGKRKNSSRADPRSQPSDPRKGPNPDLNQQRMTMQHTNKRNGKAPSHTQNPENPDNLEKNSLFESTRPRRPPQDLATPAWTEIRTRHATKQNISDDNDDQPEPLTPPEPNRTHIFDSDPDPGTGKSANKRKTKKRTKRKRKKEMTEDQKERQRKHIKCSYAKKSSHRKLLFLHVESNQNEEPSTLITLARENTKIRAHYDNLTIKMKAMTRSYRKDWSKIDPLMYHRANLLTKHNLFTHLRHFPRIKALVQTDHDIAEILNGKPQNVIYILTNPEVKRFYIGSSQNALERWHSHIRSGLKPPKSIRTQNPIMERLYSFMNNNNPHSWLLLPIAIITDFDASKENKQLLQKIESEYINKINPALNTLKGSRILKQQRNNTITHLKHWKKSRPQRSRQTRARIRRRTQRETTEAIFKRNRIAVTTFTLHLGTEQFHTYELQKILNFIKNGNQRSHTRTEWLDRVKKAQRTGKALTHATQYPIIEWTLGRCSLTKLTTEMLTYGTSKVRYGQKTTHLATVLNHITKDKKSNGIFRMEQIIKSQRAAGRLAMLCRLLANLEDARFIAHKITEKFDLNGMIANHYALERLEQCRTKMILEQGNANAMAYKYDYKLRANLVATLPFSNMIDRHKLLSTLKRLIKGAQIPNMLKTNLLQRERTKVVFTKIQSIADQTRNYKKMICNRYDPNSPPACCCDCGILREILPPEAFEQFEDGTSHIAFKSVDFKIFLEQADGKLRRNSLFKRQRHHLHEIAQTLQTCSSNIPHPRRGTDTNLEDLRHMITKVSDDLIQKQENITYPLIALYRANDAFISVREDPRDKLTTHIRKTQAQFILDRLPTDSEDPTAIRARFSTKIRQLRMEIEKIHLALTPLPWDLSSYIIKAFEIHTQHFTHAAICHHKIQSFTTIQDSYKIASPWTHNSLINTTNKQIARTAIYAAFTGCQKFNSSHVLLVPVETGSVIEELEGLNRIKINKHRTIQHFESPHFSSKITNETDTLNRPARKIEEKMILITITKSKEWMTDMDKKLQKMDKIWERHTRPRPELQPHIDKSGNEEQPKTPDTLLEKALQLYPTAIKLRTTLHNRSLEKLQLIWNLQHLGMKEPEKMEQELKSLIKTTMEEQKTAITQERLDDVKAFFKRFVFSELDKNNGASLISCPVHYFKKLKAAFTLDPHYTDVMKAESELLTDWKKFWTSRVDKASRLTKPNWKNAEIPNAYILLKNKDIKKHRPITSYFKHPMKRQLNAAHAALSHIMAEVKKKARMHFTFNIEKPSNLKKLVQEMNMRIRDKHDGSAEIRLFMGDIKQMYTELDHDELKQAVEWIIALFHKVCGNDMTLKIRRRFRKTDKQMNVLNGNNWTTKKDYMIWNTDTLKRIISFDIDNTFFKVGTQIYKQIKGIPMGSNISPALAYLICEFYERRIPTEIPDYRRSCIFGARYMDDLFLATICDTHDKTLHQLLAEDLKKITNTQHERAIYHKDLTIKPEMTTNGAECLGALIYVRGNRVHIRYLNKNEQSLLRRWRHPSQKVLRFQHRHSFSPTYQKKGMIIGELTRIISLSSNDRDILKQTELLAMELRLLDYPRAFVIKAINQKITHDDRPIWHAMSQRLQRI